MKVPDQQNLHSLAGCSACLLCTEAVGHTGRIRPKGKRESWKVNDEWHARPRARDYHARRGPSSVKLLLP